MDPNDCKRIKLNEAEKKAGITKGEKLLGMTIDEKLAGITLFQKEKQVNREFITEQTRRAAVDSNERLKRWSKWYQANKLESYKKKKEPLLYFLG